MRLVKKGTDAQLPLASVAPAVVMEIEFHHSSAGRVKPGRRLACGPYTALLPNTAEKTHSASIPGCQRREQKKRGLLEKE